MNKKPYTFIFFGTVGSGKGTQVELLTKYLKENNLSDDVVSLSTGGEYRKLIQSENYTGQIVKKTIDKGHLQPDFLTTSLFTNTLISSVKEGTTIITDGFPRTTAQSESFEMAMKFYGREDIHIVYIDIDEDEAVRRMMLRGRSDDTKEGIEKRFEEYKKNVIPSMNYFNGKPGYIIHSINGKQSIDGVYSDILKELKSILS